MISVYYTYKNRDIPEDDWERGINLLPDFISEKCRRYIQKKDRDNALLGKLLLLYALMEHGYSKDALMSLSYDGYGKPHMDFPIEFSITHSGCHVLLAYSDTDKVGIDVETILPIDLNDFEKVLTKEEWQYIMTTHLKADLFYKIWTIKESVLKAHGNGLSIPLKEVRIHAFDSGNAYSTCNSCQQNDVFTASLFDRIWYLKELQLTPEAKCHLAFRRFVIKNIYSKPPTSDTDIPNFHIFKINPQNLIRNLWK